MFSVSFVVPSWHYWDDPLKHQPYWEMYYSTVINRHYENTKEAHVDLLDLRGIPGNSLNEVIEKTPQKDVYLYWIFKSGDAMELYSVAKLLKKMYPDSIHVAGGTHVDMCPEECLNYFDSIVLGPGENSFVKAIEASRKKTPLEKIYQQKYTEVPFKDTPFPNRELLPRERAVNNLLFSQYGGPLATLVYFSRGCVYRCSFCVYNVPNTLQVKSPEMMRAELSYLKENYKIEAILLKDEVAIHPNPKVSAPMFEVIGEAGLKWRGQTTSGATYEQLKLASQSGCKELAVGVETVDNQVMKIINKEWQNEDQIREFISNCKEFGIKVKMCLIFGLPGEPPNIVDKTISFIEETKPDYVSLSGFCPIPGSPIFKNPEYYGIKFIDKDWSKHAHLLFRFSDEEEVGLPFEYLPENQWGKTHSRIQIMENVKVTQRWLEEQQMLY